MAKRFFDLCVVVVISPAVLLILAVCALLVRATSPGPAFFRQVRIGRYAKPFVIWKLRTLYEGTGHEQGYVSDHDARITSIGRVLRKTRLDEFPQFLNVLVGDMSIVGPRPLTPETIRRCLSREPMFLRRLTALPGMTGLTQIRPKCYCYGPRFTLRIDTLYIKNQTLWLDICIISHSLSAPFRHLPKTDAL